MCAWAVERGSEGCGVREGVVLSGAGGGEGRGVFLRSCVFV